MEYLLSEYTASQRKQLINTKQLYEHYIRQKNRYYRDFNLSMFWKKSGGKEYLTKQNSITKKTSSLGVRTTETEKIHSDFISHKDALKTELSELEARMEKMRKLNKIELLGRAPASLIRIYRKINELGLNSKIILIGTNALYAYESHCGVFVAEEQLATDDIDLLNKKSKELSLVFTEVLPGGKLSELLRLIDPSFIQDSDIPYRFRNKEGMLIELISPISQKMSFQTYRKDPLFTDIIDLEMEGMQWLENSRIFESMVIDETGAFAIIPTIHPLEFAVYKHWLSSRHDREILKKQRDFEQSRLVTQLIRDYMVDIDTDAELVSMKHFNRDAIDAYRREMKK